ncbi:putative Histidine kinase [Desulfamplus magnetovallimortis]|uniref:histidine kinase n=1 Tax=Desulfamplus magnetovallimortis TaxID=1246637 RepID=A0A1W1H6T5_9BACT|nr:transporter substrate-binding domain-containing protein [Desulfamplus magnetovallimortis]SLM28183.1 putative Histidine kinase [Desulfamplus magnetovallimortis]
MQIEHLNYFDLFPYIFFHGNQAPIAYGKGCHLIFPLPNRKTNGKIRQNLSLFSFFIFTLFFLSLIMPYSSLALADQSIKSPLTIRVGAYENRPKIYSENSGNIVGLFPDVLNYIAQKEGWKLGYIHGSWSECLDMLEKNDIDIMVDVAFSEERAERYSFNHETFLVNWATVYTNDRVTTESLIDLNGKRVAVMKGSIHTEGDGGIKKLAHNFDVDCKFIEVEDYKDVFELLSADQADAGIVNRIFGSLFAEEYGLVKTSIIFNPRHLKFAFPKESPLASTLISKIDHHLYKLKKDPGSIYNKAIYVYLSGLPRELIFSEPQIYHSDKSVVLTSEEKAWIRNHPVIRIGIDPEFAPFEYLDPNGSYSGIASDYLTILTQRVGLEFEVTENISWKDAVEKAQHKEIDLLPCVAITQERKAFLKFSRPYISFHRAIITRTDSPFLTGIDDIENMEVAVQRNSSHEGYLRENTKIQPLLYDTLQKSLLAVSNGQAQAFVGNIASSTYWIRKLNLTNLKVAAPVSQDTQTLHIAIRNDWPELLGIVNKALASIEPEEENAIRNRWINIEYKPGIAPRIIWRYAMQIGAGALIILFVILIWNYKLQKEIQKRIEIDEKLNEANKELKKLDQLKSMFIASMSHELRTPLNSIIGFTGVIVQGMTGPLNDKQKDHLTRVYNSAKHLLSLITDVIDISKIEAGRIDIYPEDIILSEIVDEAVINIEPQLKAKKLELVLSVPEELKLHTDRKRLLQCIINYMSNAVKFTEAGRITLTSRMCGQNVEILVSDTGIGISKENQPKLFEAFERLDSRLKIKAGGTGLGLYLTKKLATEILGGEIIFRSEEGRGSTFGLLIPSKLVSMDNKTEQAEKDNP